MGTRLLVYSSRLDTVNLEILVAKIFSVSRIIDILANINFSDSYIHEYLAISAQILSS